MARDHKVGRHWIWLYPLLWLYLSACGALKFAKRVCLRTHAMYINWRYPQLRDLKKRAGIHDQTPTQE